MKKVFISHPTPFTKMQSQFLSLIENELNCHALIPVNLGKKNWSYKSPLNPIRELMSTCSAALIIGLERHHSYIGYDNETSTEKRSELIHKITTSPWVHIEAGMAYQAGLPLLILKDKKVFAEGILDAQISEYKVFDFDLGRQSKQISSDLKGMIAKWASDVNGQ